MSKAFTSEETSEEVVVGRPVTRAARGQERPITPQGYRALTASIHQLKEVDRPALRAQPPSEAREAATQQLDHRLALLTATLESVRIVDPPAAGDEVRFGSVVRLAWDDGTTQSLSLVGPDEHDAAAGRLSVHAPLGRSLLGHVVGDDVEVSLPRGVRTATVLEIRPLAP
jgi:transcription elongation factor GreB